MSNLCAFVYYFPSAFVCAFLSAECPVISSLKENIYIFSKARASGTWMPRVNVALWVWLLTMNIQLKRKHFPSGGRPFFFQGLLSVLTPSSLKVTFCRTLSLSLPVWATWPFFVLPASGIHSAVKGCPQKTVFCLFFPLHCLFLECRNDILFAFTFQHITYYNVKYLS